MADELNAADADASWPRSPSPPRTGARGRTLAALTDNIQARLRALREVAAERAKPRAVVRQVTGITVGVLAITLATNPAFFAPYATPMGSLAAACLVSAYLGCLAILRRKTVPPPAPRS